MKNTKTDQINELIAMLKNLTADTIVRKDLVKLVKDAGHDEDFSYPALRVSGASVTRGIYSVAIMLNGLQIGPVKKAKVAKVAKKKVAKKAKGKKTAPKKAVDIDAEIAAEINDEMSAADLDEDTDVDIEWTEDDLGEDELDVDDLACYA